MASTRAPATTEPCHPRPCQDSGDVIALDFGQPAGLQVAQSRFVPRQRFLESPLNVVPGLVSQQATRLADIGLRMADVAGTEILVNGRSDAQNRMSLLEQPAQRLEHRIERQP